MEHYRFQYCQKIVVLSKDRKSVLLCKRKGEADYDGVYSFIGGKMETTDSTLLEGLQREKDEEVGTAFKIQLFPTFSVNLLFKKKDGNTMILPHYLAFHASGEIVLNEEYEEYAWVPLEELATFEPKIASVPETVKQLHKLEALATESELQLL